MELYTASIKTASRIYLLAEKIIFFQLSTRRGAVHRITVPFLCIWVSKWNMSAKSNGCSTCKQGKEAFLFDYASKVKMFGA